MGWVKLALEFLSNVTGIWKKKQELNNAPKMQARKEAQGEVKATEATSEAIRNRDLEALRKDGAE